MASLSLDDTEVVIKTLTGCNYSHSGTEVAYYRDFYITDWIDVIISRVNGRHQTVRTVKKNLACCGTDLHCWALSEFAGKHHSVPDFRQCHATRISLTLSQPQHIGSSSSF